MSIEIKSRGRYFRDIGSEKPNKPVTKERQAIRIYLETKHSPDTLPLSQRQL